jgi:hypothetical protein
MQSGGDPELSGNDKESKLAPEGGRMKAVRCAAPSVFQRFFFYRLPPGSGPSGVSPRFV